jgi:hypothetical protein
VTDDAPDTTAGESHDERPEPPSDGNPEPPSEGSTPGHERGVTAVAGDVGDAAGEGTAAEPSRHEGRTFGWRGWLLVAWMVVALVVIPAYLFFYPRASETLALFGLGYRDTLLVLPLIPALVLGALAVWATTRP